MNFEQIKELISIIDNSKLAYFEIENKEGYIKIDKSMSRNYVSNKFESVAQGEIKNTSALEVASATDGEAILSVENDVKSTDELQASGDFEYIKSPIVGTFYSKSSPTAQPFVAPGDVVSKGDVVCIIEAMKLMNEITAEFDCEIVSVLGQDSKMVEYGQELFKVKKL